MGIPQTTWEYSGAHVTQERAEDVEDQPATAIRVHLRVERYAADEISGREQPRPVTDDEEKGAQESLPTLEELGCVFSLQILGSDDPQESDVLTDSTIDEGAAPEEDEDEAAAAARAAALSRKCLFTGADGVWYHTFDCPVSFDEELAIAVCGGRVVSILKLVKGDQELILLPLDLSPFVAAERHIELWCSLELTQLSRAPYHLKGFSVLLECDKDVLSRGLRQELNPMRITVTNVHNLPCEDTSGRLGQSFKSMRETCRPAFCRYNFLGTAVETHGVLQASTLPFKASRVWCIGKHPVSDLQTYLLQNKLVVNLFDREPIPIQAHTQDMQGDEQEAAQGQSAGESDIDGEEAGEVRERPPPVWSGLRTIDKARAGEELAVTPHGVATIDLSPLVKMASDRLVDTQMVVPARVQHKSIYQPRCSPSAFLDHGTSLTVQVDLAYPLMERHEHGNLQRAVIILRYADTDRLHELEEVILRRNCQALNGVQTVPLDPSLGQLLLAKSIAAVSLSKQQREDPNLDFVSGLQLIDGEFRVFVLEGLIECRGYLDPETNVFTADVPPEAPEAAKGLTWREVGSEKPIVGAEIENAKLAAELELKLEFTQEEWDGFEVAYLSRDSYIKAGNKYFMPREAEGEKGVEDLPEENEHGHKREVRKGAMMEVLEALPRLIPNGEGDGKIFWNPDLSFNTRLYGEFNADILKVKLTEPLRKLVARADVGLEGKYEPTLNAIVRLLGMMRSVRTMQQVRQVGFPSPAQVRQLYKKFGAALSVSDIEGVPKRSISSMLEEGGVDSLSAEEVLTAAKDLPGRPRRNPPTDTSNEAFGQFKSLKAKAPTRNYLQENKDLITKMSEQAGLRSLRVPRAQPDWIDGDGGDIYMYGSQYLTFGEMHRKFVQHRLRANAGKFHFTYSKDFLSGAFVLQDPEDAKREEDRANKNRWLTKEGFRTVLPSKASEFRTHESEWGEPRRSKQTLISGLELDNLHTQWLDPGLQGRKHDLDIQEAGRGLQRNPERPIAQTVHHGQAFRRYHAHAAPQEFHLQGGVFGHRNPGYMDSVHASQGGAELDRIQRITKELDTWRSKIKGEQSSMLSLLKQPAKLSQIDRYGMTMLRDTPRSHHGKTLAKAPEGILDPFPVSIFARESYRNPAYTATLATYGPRLQFSGGVDGSERTCCITSLKAVGVTEKKRHPTMHEKNFLIPKAPPKDCTDSVCHRIRFPKIGKT